MLSEKYSNFKVFLDNSVDILAIVSVPGQHVNFDDTDNCVFRHLLFGGWGGERLAGPNPDRLPSPSPVFATWATGMNLYWSPDAMLCEV